MMTQVLTGLVLLVLPVAYNLFFTPLARGFDYPDILRQPTGQVLARFAAGGSRLVLIWWGFAMSAVLLAPAVVLVSATLADADPTVLALATAIGLLAAPGPVPGPGPLAVRGPAPGPPAGDPATTSATRDAVEVVFQTLNRYLGVAVGEHLGYLFTGLWTALAGVALLQSDVLHPLFGIAGLLLAPLFVLGSLEFVGGFESSGWKPAGNLVPLAYIGWSVWLLALGISLLRHRLIPGSLQKRSPTARRCVEPLRLEHLTDLDLDVGAVLAQVDPSKRLERGPPLAAHARARTCSASRSSWRTCPKVNERRNVPSVEGAMTRWPSTLAVCPQPSRSASSMQSPPASSEWTRVNSLRPGRCAPGRSPRSISCIGGLLDPQPLGQGGRPQQARVGDGVGVVEAGVELVQGVGGCHREGALLI